MRTIDMCRSGTWFHNLRGEYICASRGLNLGSTNAQLKPPNVSCFWSDLWEDTPDSMGTFLVSSHEFYLGY